MAKEVYTYFLFFAALYFTISMFYRLKLYKHPKLNKSTELSFSSMCFFFLHNYQNVWRFFIIITPVWWFVFSHLWCYSCNHLGEPEIVPIIIKMNGYVQWPMTIYLFLHLYSCLLSVAHYIKIRKINSLLMGSYMIFTTIISGLSRLSQEGHHECEVHSGYTTELQAFVKYKMKPCYKNKSKQPGSDGTRL